MTQIKTLRQSHGYTQQDIADLLGITRGAYANIENDRREPDFATLLLLADHYDVTVDYLIGHEKGPAVPDGEPSDVNDDEYQLILLFRAASPDDQDAIRAILRKYRPAAPVSSPLPPSQAV